MVYSLELTDTPLIEDVTRIGDALTDFNAQDTGPSGRRALVVLIRGEDSSVTGGLCGYTAWGWLYIQWLFVPENLRGTGMAGKVLAMSEAEAVNRKCHGAWIDTFNPAALRAYQRAGYEIFGSLEDFPPGRERSFLRKTLARLADPA